MTQPRNRSVVLAKIESSYGTDPTPADGTNEIYVEDWTDSFDAPPIERTGMSPYRGGFKPAAGPTRPADLSFAVEIAPKTITDGNSRPLIDALWRACSFTATASVAGDPKTITYKPQSDAGESVTLYKREFNHSKTAQLLKKFLGARFDWVVALRPRERSMLALSGMSLSPADPTDVASGPSGSLAYQLPAPIVAGGGVLTITELGADTAYDTSTYRCVELEIRGQMEVVAQNSLTGTDGVQAIVLRPTGPIKAKLVLEQTAASVFDPRTYQGATTALQISYAQPNPATAGNYVQHDLLAYIVGISDGGEDGGNKIWELDLSTGYPESGGDGGGLVPAEGQYSVTYGTKS